LFDVFSALDTERLRAFATLWLDSRALASSAIFWGYRPSALKHQSIRDFIAWLLSVLQKKRAVHAQPG
jgi:hypothetical protein